MRPRRLVVSVLLLVILIVAVRLVVVPLARPALGYVAKVTCSQVFVGGLTPEAAIAELPDLAVTRVIRAHGGLRPAGYGRPSPGWLSRVAVYHDGLGCTLIPTGRPDRRVSELPAAGPVTPEGWPRPSHGRRANWSSRPCRLGWTPQSSRRRSTGRSPSRATACSARPGRWWWCTGAGSSPSGTPRGSGRKRGSPGWSMTKSVGSALVGILVGEGRLRLDSANLFPAWRAEGDPRAGHHAGPADVDERRTGARRELHPDGRRHDSCCSARETSRRPRRRRRRGVHPGSTWYYASAAANLIRTWCARPSAARSRTT